MKNLEMPGGKRSLNDALKTAWRDQLKENNRSSADKVVVALTTGNKGFFNYKFCKKKKWWNEKTKIIYEYIYIFAISYISLYGKIENK